MPYIPQEILDIIIGYSTADGRYFSCAYISHTFHQIVLPYKFKSLTFWNRRRNIADVNSIPKFCEAINAGDAHALFLAPLVQELNLRLWDGKDGNHLIQEPFEKIINSVLSFRNLTKLSMEYCVVSLAIMEQLGKFVQLQSLHIFRCKGEPDVNQVSYGALSNLQSLHTLECEGNWNYVKRHLACIPMKNLRILKSSDLEVIVAFLTTDPSVQLKELRFTHHYYDEYFLLWNYLARVTSLTHLSLPYLKLPEGPPSLLFTFPELRYLHIHVALAPRFADQPMKVMKIYTDSDSTKLRQAMKEVHQHWQGIVFPLVEYLQMDRWRIIELISIPIEFWRVYLSNVKEVL